MLKFSEIFEFSKEKFRKIPILKEFEWFEWFGPSPIEPFNSEVESEARKKRSAVVSDFFGEDEPAEATQPSQNISVKLDDKAYDVELEKPVKQ